MGNNPFAQAPHPVQLVVLAKPQVLDAIEAAAEEWVLSISREFDHEEARQHVVTHMAEGVSSRLVLLVDTAQEALVREVIAQAAADEKVTVRSTKLADIDWVSKVQKDFPAFVMGPFYVHGSHATNDCPPNRFPLLIDAAAAFGTGEHATTAGCLLALAREKKRRPQTPRVLDMGCGTAILAIGAARLWKNARIVASDYDPVAVDVSRHNVRVNRIAARCELYVSDGYLNPQLKRGGPYPVIVANILARPLMRMARYAVQHLAPGGTLILSGLLRSQEAMVLSAHRAQGLYLTGRIRRGQWSVLILQKAH